MKHTIAKVKNVVRLEDAYAALEARAHGLDGMGLVYGPTGAGKTTAVAWHIVRTRGVYLRALACWTPSDLLASICAELRLDAHGRNAVMFARIAQALSASDRAVYVDEADHLLPHLRMLETLRDIHDIAGAPVILIGMAGIERRLQAREQLLGRVSQWVEFLPADLEDARTLADSVAEVDIADDLLAYLHAQARGSMRRMTIGIHRIEQAARAAGVERIDRRAWGKRELLLGRGDA